MLQLLKSITCLRLNVCETFGYYTISCRMVNKRLSFYSSHFIDEYKGPTSRRQSVLFISFFRGREWGWIEDERNKGRKTLTQVPISLPMSSGCQGTLFWWWTIWYWLAFEQAFCRSLGVGWWWGPTSENHFLHILIFSSLFEWNIFQFFTILNIPSLNKRHQLQAQNIVICMKLSTRASSSFPCLLTRA